MSVNFWILRKGGKKEMIGNDLVLMEMSSKSLKIKLPWRKASLSGLCLSGKTQTWQNFFSFPEKNGSNIVNGKLKRTLYPKLTVKAWKWPRYCSCMWPIFPSTLFTEGLFSLVLQRFPEVVTGEMDIDQIALEKIGNRTVSQAVVDSLAWEPLVWENLAPTISCWLCS